MLLEQTSHRQAHRARRPRAPPDGARADAARGGRGAPRQGRVRRRLRGRARRLHGAGAADARHRVALVGGAGEGRAWRWSWPRPAVVAGSMGFSPDAHGRRPARAPAHPRRGRIGGRGARQSPARSWHPEAARGSRCTGRSTAWDTQAITRWIGPQGWISPSGAAAQASRAGRRRRRNRRAPWAPVPPGVALARTRSPTDVVVLVA
jgi:hypothetical protein